MPIRVSQVVLEVKNLPDNARDKRDLCLIPGSRRPPGGEHGNTFQYSCLENPMDRGAWWSTVCRVAKSWTWLKQLNTQAHRTNHSKWLISLCWAHLERLILNKYNTRWYIHTFKTWYRQNIGKGESCVSVSASGCGLQRSKKSDRGTSRGEELAFQGFPGNLVVKYPPASAGDTGLIPDSRGSHMHLGPRATSIETVLFNKRSHRNEKPVHHT